MPFFIAESNKLRLFPLKKNMNIRELSINY